MTSTKTQLFGFAVAVLFSAVQMFWLLCTLLCFIEYGWSILNGRSVYTWYPVAAIVSLLAMKFMGRLADRAWDEWSAAVTASERNSS